MSDKRVTAVLYSEKEPDDVRRARFGAFLRRKYGAGTSLEWRCDPEVRNGFKLVVGADVYNWTTEARLAQLKEEIYAAGESEGGFDVIPLIKESLENGARASLPTKSARSSASATA